MEDFLLAFDRKNELIGKYSNIRKLTQEESSTYTSVIEEPTSDNFEKLI